MSKLARLALTVLLALGAVLAVALPASAAPSCTGRWGSLPEEAAGRSPASITDLRVGRHPCSDRIVFDTSFPAAGYSVEYVDVVTAPGSGFPVETPGGARLQVEIHHPSYGALDTDVTGFDTLRSIRWAGSFEGRTTFGVGTRARLPFRVFTLPARGDGGRIVLDVAHHCARMPA